MTEGDLDNLVRIEDPDFFDDPHPVLTRLRRERPVFHYKPLDVFVLSKYEDIRLVGRTPEIFSSAQGFLLNDIRYGNTTKDLFTMPGADFLSTSDPPRHRELRRMVSPLLTPRSMAALEEPIREFCTRTVDNIVPGEPIDFVNDIAGIFPLYTVAHLFGVPDRYAESLRFWADEFLKAGAALDREGLNEAAANTRKMVAFFDEWLVRKSGTSATDLMGAMIKMKHEGADLSYENMHMFLSSLMTGGIETTKDFLTASLLAFIEYPEQRQRFRDDIEGLAESATEECLRWTTPVHGFIRTVTRDTEIRGVEIKTGQHVQMLWTSGNRDEDIWERADQFDISRTPNPMHVAFGFGEHACLGAALARLQGRVFLEEIVRRFSSWEVAGPLVRPPSVLHNAYSQAPMIFHV